MDYLYKNFIDDIKRMTKELANLKTPLTEAEKEFITLLGFDAETFYQPRIEELKNELKNKIRFYNQYKEQFNSRGYYLNSHDYYL